MNNPSAFPTGVGLNATKTWVGSGSSGMTLRDYFAAKVLQGFITRETNLNTDFLMYARTAYHMADAMLEAREQ